MENVVQLLLKLVIGRPLTKGGCIQRCQYWGFRLTSVLWLMSLSINESILWLSTGLFWIRTGGRFCFLLSKRRD